MLLLAFQIGEDRYAFDAARVLRVLPLLQLKQVPLAPRGIAGLLKVRETCVPVVDLSAAALGRPARRSVSTRLVLVGETVGANVTKMLGVIVEKATGMLNVKPEALMSAGVAVSNAPYLGPVVSDANGLVQLVDIDRLIPEEIRAVLLK